MINSQGQQQSQQEYGIYLIVLYYIILVQKQNIMNQQQLQHKLQEVNKKLKLVCQSYINLKAQLKAKDQHITQLQVEIARLNQSEEAKENNRVQDIRKKYQMESVLRPTDKITHRNAYSSNQGRVLAQAKSVSPKKFKRTQITQPLQPQPLKYQPKYEPISKSFTTAIPPQASRPPINSRISPNLNKQSSSALVSDTQIKAVGVDVDLSKYEMKLREIDRQYNTDLAKDMKQDIESEDVSRVSMNMNMNRDRKINRGIKDSLDMEIALTKVNDSMITNPAHQLDSEKQNQMLKQIWEQRDKEIQRMDELFQNLNKRIYGTQ